MAPALEPATRPVDGRRVAVRESSPLCLSATPLEGMVWSPDGCDKHRQFNSSCGNCGTEGVDTLKVRNAGDVEQAVRAAIASEQPLEIIGHGSKRLIGHPIATNALLDLSAPNASPPHQPTDL